LFKQFKTLNHICYIVAICGITNIYAADSISKLVLEATNQNPQIKAQQSDVQSAKYSQDEAFWQYFPTPTISADNWAGGSQSASLKLQQPLYTGGKLSAQYDKAKNTASSAEMSLEETRLTMGLNVAQTINDLIAANGRFFVYSESAQRLEQYHGMIKRRIKAGVSPQSDLYLAQARLTEAQIGYETAVAEQERSLVALGELVGRKVELGEMNDVLFKEACKINLPSIYKKTNYVASVLQTHPGLKRYDKQIDAAKNEVEIKQSSLLPTLYTKAETYSASNNSAQARYSIGVQYTPNAGLSSLSAISAAKANVITITQEKDKFKADLVKQANDLLIDYKISETRYKNYLFAVENSRQAADSYQRLFVAGKKSWYDVLNAEQDWINAQLNLSAAQATLAAMPSKLKILSSEF
jgi:adhesin transport system outer membrane protein